MNIINITRGNIIKVTSHNGFSGNSGLTETLKHPKWCDNATPSFRHTACP